MYRGKTSVLVVAEETTFRSLSFREWWASIQPQQIIKPKPNKIKTGPGRRLLVAPVLPRKSNDGRLPPSPALRRGSLPPSGQPLLGIWRDIQPKAWAAPAKAASETRAASPYPEKKGPETPEPDTNHVAPDLPSCSIGDKKNEGSWKQRLARFRVPLPEKFFSRDLSPPFPLPVSPKWDFL